MKRIDLYILRQILTPTLLALAVATTLAIGNEIRGRVTDFALYVKLGDLFDLSVLLLPLLVPIVLPFALLTGILLAMGRMAQENAFLSMQAAGISLRRVVAPVIVLSALASGASFLIQDQLQPRAIRSAWELIHTEIPQRITIAALPAGVVHRYHDWRVYFADKDTETNTLYDVDLAIPAEEGRGPTVYHAKQARLMHEDGAYVLQMTEGQLFAGREFSLTFAEQRLSVPDPPTDKKRNRQSQLSLSELFAQEQERTLLLETEPERQDPKYLKRDRREIAERLSFPFAAVAMALVGAPVAVRSRRAGRTYSFAVGLTMVAVYLLLFSLTEPTGLRALPLVILRTWVPNLIFLAAGVGLMWRLNR